MASVTTSAALMVLPTMVVGNELLIVGVVALAVGGWFLAHRHGEMRSVVAASTAQPEAKAVNSDQSSATRQPVIRHQSRITPHFMNNQ